MGSGQITGVTDVFAENERTEFKSAFTEGLYKEIVAFANSGGGDIYVGIDNEGRHVGISDIDSEYTRITNGIRDAVLPDITMFVRYSIEDNNIVHVTVSEGSNKPYYLKSKGLKPGGVYVRQGASSAPASSEAIRQMIKDSDGDVYEEMRSLNQALTFKAAGDAFERYGIDFDQTKYRSLGIIQPSESLYTNLALLLSDQCLHSIKIAVFDDAENTVFRDQKEFTGSVFTQLEEAFRYLMLCNRQPAVFKGLERVEHPDYPEAAIREALLNAIVHRDYSFSGSIIINVNDREIEFVSLGGLLPGLSEDDIRMGISQPRNKNLAEVFHRLRLIESYGTGIRRIYSLYANAPVQPSIHVTTNTFTMILPNQNSNLSGQVHPQTKPEITRQMRSVLDALTAREYLTDDDIQSLLNLKKTRTYTLTKQMQALGLITAQGRGKDKRYILPEA